MMRIWGQLVGVLALSAGVFAVACGGDGSNGVVIAGGGEASEVSGGAPHEPPDASGGKGQRPQMPAGDGGMASTSACADDSSIAPEWPSDAMLTATAARGAVLLAWPAASGADRYRVYMDEAQIATVAAVHFLAAVLPGQEHDFRVEAAELCGKFASGPEATAKAEAIGNPLAAAPDLSKTTITPFPDSVRFLYSGDNPAQIGVKPGAIDEGRVSVVRGTVTQCDGTPVAGVKVSVPTEPGLGWTFSRDDGGYDLAVNSGCCDVGIQLEANGSPTVQRKVPARALDYANVPDVVVVPYDNQVTTVDLPSAAASSAQGSLVKDTAGSRHATVIFPSGVTASMTLPDGTEEPLPTLHVRATEYTSDECGANAMPGALPAESAYTYAAELSVDEAVLAKATSVNFSKPVALYVDNFIGFPDGTPVPTGFYDRETQCWKPVPNGLVVKVTGIANGSAALDVNGDGKPDAAETLAGLGITPEEREELAKIYAVGVSLFRTPIAHFSPWDCNWPYRPDGDGKYPDLKPTVVAAAKVPEPCEVGSDIGCVNGSLRETVPLLGAGNALVYSSKLVPRPYAIDFPITNGDIGALSRAELDVSVAGRAFHAEFDAKPNQVHRFTWDGLDAYGREVAGSAKILAKLTYWYKSVYAAPDNRFGDSPIEGKTFQGQEFKYIPARREVSLWAEWSGTAEGKKPASSGLFGGWALADHISLDPTSHELSFGSGEVRRLAGTTETKGGYIVETFAGNGKDESAGDGGRARDAGFRLPSGMAFAADGALYIADAEAHVVRRIGADGIIQTVAGTGNVGLGLDEGRALEIDLFRPMGLSIDCDGSLFIEDQAGFLVRKLTPDGFLHRLPFRQNVNYFEGLNGPAFAAAFYNYKSGNGVAPGSNCRVYFRGYRGVVVRLDPSDELTLVAGDPAADNANPRLFAENTQAKFTSYRGSGSFAYEPRTGAILESVGLVFAEEGHSGAIIRITPDGTQHLVAGDTALQVGATGDGGPAVRASLGGVDAIATLRDGSIILLEQDLLTNETLIRRIDTDGIISTIAGGSARGEGIPALGAHVGGRNSSLAVGPDDSIYVSSFADRVIRRIRLKSGFGSVEAIASAKARRSALATSASDSIAASETAVPDSTGSVVDVFDKITGQHLRSFDALTGVLQRAYKYDDGGKLESISDAFGNTTTYAYSPTGLLSSVTSPYGLVTTLHYGNDGNLDSVTNPAGEAYAFTYKTGTQFLASLQTPAGNLSSFAYDELGRLSKDTDAAGGSKTLAQTGTEASPRTTITTAGGRTNSYGVDIGADGTVQARSIEKYYGASAATVTDPNGSRTVTYEGGSSFANSSEPDPRFGWFSPMAGSLTMKSGAQSSTTVSARQYTLSDPLDPFSVTAFAETNTVDGKAYSRKYDRLAKTVTTQLPTGRTSTVKLNELGQVVESSPPGVAPIAISYDERGRTTGYTQGDRTTSIEYDERGFISSTTDALGRVRRYSTDAVGRVLSVQLGANATDPSISSTYDQDSNLMSVMPPSGAIHGLSYTPVDLLASYEPPKLLAAQGTTPTTFTYNLDRQVTAITRADGDQIHFAYDATTARAKTVTLPGSDGEIAYTYDDAVTKDLAGFSGPAGTSFGLEYTDGLVSSLAWSGTVKGAVRKAYDGKFRLASESVDGFDGSNAFTYDADGLLKSASGVSITREALTGRVAGTSYRSIVASRSYDATYGELSEYKATAFGTTLYGATYTRDLLGRITGKSETINGVTTAYTYGYDDQGRLETVTAGGTTTASYSYDLNGNRTERQAGATTQVGTYDEQDRLVSYGTAQYTYNESGDLLTKTVGSLVRTYHYDALSNLRQLKLSDGTVIDFEVDGAGRRVGKSVNGTLVNGYLYRNGQQLKAVTDGAGKVLAVFGYGPAQTPLTMQTASGSSYQIIADDLGSVRLVVDAFSGATLQRLSYDEFGRVTEDTNPGFQPFGYAGGLYDPQTGLVRFGARDYDPQIGRWNTKDPILLGGGLNLYQYVGNDPINSTDISGLLKGVPDWLLWLDDHGVLQGAGDLSAGVSSALTFGLSDKLIGATGLGKYGSKCSGWYHGGELGGMVLGIVRGPAALAKSAAVEGAEAARIAAKYVPTTVQSAIALSKQLASEAQLGEMAAGIGTRIAGAGTRAAFRNAERAAATYGGAAADWVKMSSSYFKAADGTVFGTHWVENIVTGVKVEAKVVIDVFGGR